MEDQFGETMVSQDRQQFSGSHRGGGGGSGGGGAGEVQGAFHTCPILLHFVLNRLACFFGRRLWQKRSRSDLHPPCSQVPASPCPPPGRRGSAGA